MENKVRLTGLWKERTQDGKPYLSGKLTGSSRLVIFPNDRKTKDTDPDFAVYVVPVEKKAEAPARAETPTFDL